jgi:hypothetical protein
MKLKDLENRNFFTPVNPTCMGERLVFLKIKSWLNTWNVCCLNQYGYEIYFSREIEVIPVNDPTEEWINKNS